MCVQSPVPPQNRIPKPFQISLKASARKMKKLLSVQLASNIPRKLCITSSFLHYHPYKSFSSRTQTTLNHLLTSTSTTQQPPHFFSHFTTCPYSWLSQNSTVSKKVFGVLSNPLLVKQFVSTTHMDSKRKPHKGLVSQISDSQIRRVAKRATEETQSQEREEGQSREREKQRKSWFRRLDSNDTILGLVIANVAVFMLWQIVDREFMKKNFAISLDNFGSGRVHTMITSTFSHIGIGHVFFNMIGLYCFGRNIGKFFGPGFLLKLYLAGAVGGSVFYLVNLELMALSSEGLELRSRTRALTASGAVTAITLLHIFLFPKSIIYVDFFIPVPSYFVGIFLIGKDILNIRKEGDGQLSAAVHLGGAVVAAIAWAQIRKGRFRIQQ